MVRYTLATDQTSWLPENDLSPLRSGVPLVPVCQLANANLPPTCAAVACVFVEGLVAQMVNLSGRGDEDVQQICSSALNQVPPDMVELDDKMVKVLVSLLQVTGRYLVGDSTSSMSEPSLHDLKSWNLRQSAVREKFVEAQPSWVNDICQDLEVSGGSCPPCPSTFVRIPRKEGTCEYHHGLICFAANSALGGFHGTETARTRQ